MIALRAHLPNLVLTAGWIAALTLAAWLAAGWFWRLAGREPVVLPLQVMTDPVAAARAVAQRQWFGEAAPSSASPAAARAPEFTLVGAMTAGGGRPGFALLKQPGQAPLPVLEGEQIVPGVTLGQVRADRVTLLRDGGGETLELATRAPAVAPSVKAP